MHHNIGFIGGGNMAASIIGGLADQSLQESGRESRQQIWAYDRDQNRLDELNAQWGVTPAASNAELVKNCAVIVLAIKPQIMQAVISEIAELLREHRPLMISVAAGIQCSSICKWIGTACPVVRVMPNTPALIGLGASALFANTETDAAQQELAEQLLQAVGTTVWVAEEDGINLATALSGSGPAYFMLFLQQLIEAGVRHGLSADSAHQLALQTARGAAELVRHSDQSIQTLIDNVTSPNGTTERALQSFHQQGLDQVVENAFIAALERARELGDELDT